MSQNYKRYIVFEGEKQTRIRIYDLSKHPAYDGEINARQLLKLAMDCLIAYVRIISKKGIADG
tara:strand:+ start:233 stop:421 length:189 start_codon:yes stop_codon:yes gene_type:complete